MWRRPCGACFFTCRFKAQQQRKKKKCKRQKHLHFCRGCGAKMARDVIHRQVTDVRSVRNPDAGERLSRVANIWNSSVLFGKTSEDVSRSLSHANTTRICFAPPPHRMFTHSSHLDTPHCLLQYFPVSLFDNCSAVGCVLFLLLFFLVHSCTVWLSGVFFLICVSQVVPSLMYCATDDRNAVSPVVF